MIKQRSWTEKEIGTLRTLYPISASFIDLQDSLPDRSSNSIRLMASRLGVRRPTLLTGIEKVKEIKPSATADGSVLIRCSGCGSWVDVVIKNVPPSRVVVCDNCGCVNLVAD